MALTYSGFSSFKVVKDHYESIQPIKERGCGTTRNIRPMGDRARKWERIVRVSRNCYALSDGYHYGDNMFPEWGNADYDHKTKTWTIHQDRLGKMEDYAPVVWRRHKDGTETVQLRNVTGSNSGYSIGRYDFLRRHTPFGLSFVAGGNGNQFIHINHKTGNESFFLPKSKTVPRGAYKFYKGSRASAHTNWMQLKDCKSALVFKNEGGGAWSYISGGGDTPRQPSKTVKKEVKARYKKRIAAFKEWAFTMGAMLPLRDYEYIRQMDQETKELAKEEGIDVPSYYGGAFHHLDGKYKRKIISNDQHPMRLHLAVSALREVDFYNATDELEVKRIKQRFNTWMNNNLDFIKKG